MDFQRYFQSYKDYFWEWDNEIFSEDSVFESLTIPNGQTIGYEKFVFEILEFLSEEGVPPFGSLLLAILATNPESETTIEIIHDLAKSKNIVTAFPQSQSFRVGASIDFMKILSKLPKEYKTGEKRMKLFQTIFHQCHNRISSSDAKYFIREYKKRRHHLVRAAVKEEFNEANFRKDFRTLALLKAKFPTVQSVIKAMENIPHQELDEQLDEEVLEEKNLSEKVTDFVDQLIQEDKTFHVGSLIKRLWSGLNIPLHHSHPSEQPLGGISDLTNKGDFDKLVISEFAYDDDVFMSRIANNEALYIQREVPPEADKFKRILLIDNTLKNWGNPKILAFASAIAIARHPKTDIECEVYVVGQDFKEIAVTNVDEVITALSELSGKLDCAAGIDSFFLEHKINSKNQEVFLFSSEESLKLVPMQKVLNTYFSDIKYVFAIGMENINVYKNQNKGRKLLQQIALPLEELWERKNVEIRKTAKILSEDLLPMLYPIERFYYNIFHDGNEFYQCVGRTLFLFDTNDKFTKALKKITSHPGLLGKGDFALKTNPDKERILLNYYFFDGVHNISFLNLETNELRSQQIRRGDLPEKNLLAFVSHGMFHLTDNINFWFLQDDFTIAHVKGENIKLAYDDYVEKRASFIRNYKANRTKYNTIKKIDTVVINKNVLKINGYYFRSLKFEKDKHTFRPDNVIVLKEKVNLILKNRGTSAIAVVKIIKNYTDKDLREAKEIVDEELSVILNDVTKEVAEKLKKRIEETGAVCYIESTFFESEDGSTITIKDGVLIFESSDTRIGKFYIPFILNIQSTMVSIDEYTGNKFFISNEYEQENITTEMFTEKYLNPFILNIVHHGA
ncbi:hypothetical protein AR687_16890 [Flavobacteriaceae bacterium CRH]|nr:hypothetical protein AR687_16890 [Flavobacteriaceae bacterium CRH]